MELKELKQQSSRLFNFILIAACVNVAAFLATGFYVANGKKAISNLHATDPALYKEKVWELMPLASIGISIAMIPVLVCIILVLKRSEIIKRIIELENKQLDELDVK